MGEKCCESFCAECESHKSADDTCECTFGYKRLDNVTLDYVTVTDETPFGPARRIQEGREP